MIASAVAAVGTSIFGRSVLAKPTRIRVAPRSTTTALPLSMRDSRRVSFFKRELVTARQGFPGEGLNSSYNELACGHSWRRSSAPIREAGTSEPAYELLGYRDGFGYAYGRPRAT